MEDRPSERIVDQRIRNRIMEAVQTLAEGDEGVRAVWPAEYFESFYDWIPHHRDGVMPSNSSLTADEQQSLHDVSSILDQACDATPGNMHAEDLIATGWPRRIQPVAQRAIDLMLRRGRFREDVEEIEPSDISPWP
jgi:hypothetical protein